MWINFLEMRFAVDNSMIFFDRVTKIYGNGQKALDNVSLKVGRGEFVFLEGDSAFIWLIRCRFCPFGISRSFSSISALERMTVRGVFNS